MNTKKLFGVIIGLLVLFAFTGCPTDGGGGNGGENGTPQKLTVGYLSNLMVDIGDASALGIVRRSTPGSSSARNLTGTSEKNYLVKTTVEYSHGNVEWDESGLTNVTFQKRTTETLVIPIYDEDGNIIDEEIIEEGQIISQDEIQAQVNRLYVYNTYTFIQFVPDDTALIPDVRPDDLGRPDREGYFDYDKRNYYNDDYHQSFVIENSTGNIYSLEDNVYISYIHNGLLNIRYSPYIWDCRINENDELEIFTLFQNSMLEVSDYYKDKYGNNYIFNRSIDQIDTETSTIFFTKTEYHVSSSGEVLYIEGGLYGEASAAFISIGLDPHYSSGYFMEEAFFYGAVYSFDTYNIKVVMPNCQYRDVSADDEFYFNGYGGAILGKPYSPLYISHIINKELFLYRKPQNNLDYTFFILNTDTGEVKKHFRFAEPSSHNTTFMIFGNPLSYNTFFIPHDTGLYGHKLDYAKLTFETILGAEYAAIDSATQVFFIANAVDRGNTQQRWTVTTLDGEIEYTIVLREVDGERIPVAVKLSEYVAEEQQVITLKPINR